MESMISSLLKRYETGGLTRRDLIQGLALLAAGTAASSAAAQTAPAPIPWSPFIDHIQLNSRDPQKAAEFYQRVMGPGVATGRPRGADPGLLPGRDRVPRRRPAPYPGHPQGRTLRDRSPLGDAGARLHRGPVQGCDPGAGRRVRGGGTSRIPTASCVSSWGAQRLAGIPGREVRGLRARRALGESLVAGTSPASVSNLGRPAVS